jgi:hypothetical protein
MPRTPKKTKRNPIPLLEITFTVKPIPNPTQPGKRPTFDIVGEERVKGKSALSDSELSDLIVYFDEKVREALLTDDLPFPFQKFDASGAVEYEATVSRISEHERRISYYQHRPIKPLPRMPSVKEPILSLQIVFTIGPSPDDPAGLAIVNKSRVASKMDSRFDEIGYEHHTAPFEERVNDAVLKDEGFQELYRYYFDGSIQDQVTIARVSERERLVSYYSYPPSPKVRRKLVKEAREWRRRGDSVPSRAPAPKREALPPSASLREVVEHYKSRQAAVSS